MPLSVARRIVIVSAIAVIAMSTVTACTSAEKPSETAPAGATGYPLELPTAFGATTLMERPERVVALGDLDDALALGVIPVGTFRPAGDADDLYEYEQVALEAAQDSGAKQKVEKLFDPYAEPDYEAIARLDPDVILAASYWDLGSSYDRLAEIAPVVALEEGVQSTWESRHRLIARALDRTEEGEAAIARVYDAFDAAREANPGFADRTLSYSVVYPTQVTFMSTPDTEASWFFSELGFQPPLGADQFGAVYPEDVVSEEQTPLLDADIVVIGYHSLLESGQREAFEKSKLFQALPAVSAGTYIALPEGHDSSIPQPGVLSSLDDLAAVLPLLEEAVGE